MLRNILIFLFCFNFAFGQNKISAPLMGYNAHMSDAPKWQNENFNEQLSNLEPNTLRYPGGSNSFYWNWRKGWTLSYSELLPILIKSKFLVDGKVIKDVNEFKTLTKANKFKNPFWRQINRYNAKVPRYDKISDFAYAIKSQNAKAVFTLNLITSNVENEIEMLKEAQKNGINIEFVELGNEINSENLITKHFYPDAKTYSDTCINWATKIFKEFPNVKIGVVGGNKNRRLAQWNQILVEAIENNFYESKNQFYFILHYYPHLKNPIYNYSDINQYQQLMAFPKMDLSQRLKWWQWDATKNYETWVTEYNLIEPKPYKINNKWIHALFVSNLISELIDQSDPKMLHYHSIGSNKFPVFAAIKMIENKMEVSTSGLATSLWNRLTNDAFNLRREKSNGQQWNVYYPSKFSCECPNNPKIAKSISLNTLQIYSTTKKGLKTILVTNISEVESTLRLKEFKIKKSLVEKYYGNLDDTNWIREENTNKDVVTIPPFSLVFIKEVAND